MKIAYIILAHKFPQQLTRLVNKLNTDKTFFLIHVDKKTKYRIYQEIVRDLSKYRNVYFLDRNKCFWGGFGCVFASIKGIRKIFDDNIPCDYIALLTGQCYPIKSNQYIREFFKKINCQSIVNFFPLPSDTWINGGEKRGGMDRVEYYYFNLNLFDRYYRASLFQYKFRRKFPKSFNPFGGSAYWVFSRELAEYINLFVIHNPSLVRFFKNVMTPDELFFQTIILNSPFKDRIINSSITYTLWLDSSDHPEILTSNNFKLIDNSPALFARKFDINQDSKILDLIDKNILDI